MPDPIEFVKRLSNGLLQRVGNLVQVEGADGTVMLIDPSGSVVAVDFPHYEIHEGNYYSISYKTPDGANLANNAAIAFIMAIGDRECHMFASASIGGDGEAVLTEDAEYTGGSALPSYNHNRTSVNTSTVTTVRDPTVTNIGNQLDIIYLPGGSGGFSVGVGAPQGLGWLLKANTVYLGRIINRSGTAQPASLKLEWHEPYPG